MQEYEWLEEEFAKWTGCNHMVVCSSGTAALHLAFEVLRSSEGEGWREPSNKYVAIPDCTMIACPRAVVAAGLTPAFNNVNELGLLAKLRKPVDAVLAVHLYGRKCKTDWPVPVVEDLAEIHGLKPNPNSFAACWSFYKNKIVAGEEGGAVAFREAKHAALARELRTLGMRRKHDFMHTARGMNYRMSNLHAAPIRESLKQVDLNIKRRRQVEGNYNVVIPKEFQLKKREIPWVYDLDLPPGINTWAVVQGLIARGIPARQSFKPMSSQSEFCRLDESFRCEQAIRISKQRIYLPIWPDLSRENINLIGKSLTDLL